MSSRDDISLRIANVWDGRHIWDAVERIGALERNSCYAYLLLASHFASTCIVAEANDDIVGFVAAYRPPSAPLDVFVWQIGVTPAARGHGIGRALLGSLLAQPAAGDAHFLTATVTPDNRASMALFHGFARERGFACAVEPWFSAACFAEPHPDEYLLRVGPLSTNR
jgi:L-2,4-diaminobutyric acid acetyltransferase